MTAPRQGERKAANLCDGREHFLQHCIGLSSSSDACLNVEALGTWAGNKPVGAEDVRDKGHSVVWMWPTGPVIRVRWRQRLVSNTECKHDVCEKTPREEARCCAAKQWPRQCRRMQQDRLNQTSANRHSPTVFFFSHTLL